MTNDDDIDDGVTAGDTIDDEGGGVWIVEERPPLRAGKVFVGDEERAVISESLEAAFVALDRAFRQIWVPNALEHGHPREYWNDSDVDELEALTLEASDAVERAFRALATVVDDHAAQEDHELGFNDDQDTSAG